MASIVGCRAYVGHKRCKEVPYHLSQCVTHTRDNEGGDHNDMDMQLRAFVGKARVMGLTLHRHLSFQERQIVASFSSETHNFRYSPLLLDPRVSISSCKQSDTMERAED
jgi:hypothetical protein